MNFNPMLLYNIFPWREYLDIQLKRPLTPVSIAVIYFQGHIIDLGTCIPIEQPFNLMLMFWKYILLIYFGIPFK